MAIDEPRPRQPSVLAPRPPKLPCGAPSVDRKTARYDVELPSPDLAQRGTRWPTIVPPMPVCNHEDGVARGGAWNTIVDCPRCGSYVINREPLEDLAAHAMSWPGSWRTKVSSGLADTPVSPHPFSRTFRSSKRSSRTLRSRLRQSLVKTNTRHRRTFGRSAALVPCDGRRTRRRDRRRDHPTNPLYTVI